MKRSNDRKFMELAIEAAQKCKGNPTDPLVGAVAVRGEKVLGIAYRGEKESGQHAEYLLLEDLLTNDSLANATIYTTLEPCTKRNAPKLACVDRIIQRKVARVVIGMLDPNPVVSGFGLRKLTDANISVTLFPKDLSSKIEELNRSFIQTIKNDSVYQASRDIAELSTRSGIPRQREAIGATLRECLESLRKINSGEILIHGREAGYFKRFLERINGTEGTEHFKAFIRLTAFDPEELMDNSWFEHFYAKLEQAVHENRVVIDYVFLIRTRIPTNGDKKFIDRYKRFARRIGLVHPKDPRIPPELLHPSIVLMEKQKAAFTHDRADDSSLLQATEWVSEYHYQRLRDQFKRIEVMSRPYFAKDNAIDELILANRQPPNVNMAVLPPTPTTVETVVTEVKTERPDLAGHLAPDGTVTILFSDIVGSAVLNQKFRDVQWMDLLHEHNEIFRRLLPLHKGYEVKTIGDAFMLAFRSATDAVTYAVETQRAFTKRNNGAKQTIRLHMGLHTGEFMREADDFYGRHVNYAARIASSASAGQILVSSLVRDVLDPVGQFRFVSLKPRKLKGFRGLQKLFSVRWRKD
jgi:class 3 adenylate cyclase/pyrimidine deaminase RibD-like protein